MVLLMAWRQRRLGVQGKGRYILGFSVSFQGLCYYLYPDLGMLSEALVLQSMERFLGLVECWVPNTDEVLSFCYRTLTKWFFSTRLETRTKESSICASVWVANLYAE